MYRQRWARLILITSGGHFYIKNNGAFLRSFLRSGDLEDKGPRGQTEHFVAHARSYWKH